MNSITLPIMVWGGVGVSVFAVLYVVVNMFKLPQEDKKSFSSFFGESLLEESPSLVSSPTATYPQEKTGFGDLEIEKSLEAKEETIRELRSKIQDGQNELSRAEEENSYFRSSLGSVSQELDMLKVSLSEKIKEAEIPLIGEIKSLKEDQVRLESQRRDGDRYKALADEQIAQLRVDMEEANTNLSAARRLLEEERASFASLSSAFREKDSIIEDLAKRLSTSTRDVSKMHDEKVVLQQEVELTRKDLVESKSSVPRKVNEAKSVLQRVILELKNEREELLQKKAEVDRQLASSSKEVLHLNKELESMRRTLDMLRRSDDKKPLEQEAIARLESEKASSQKELDLIRNELSEVKDLIPQKVRHARAELQEELNALRIRHAKVLGLKSDLEKQVEYFNKASIILKESAKGPESGDAPGGRFTREFGNTTNIASDK